MSEIFTPMMGMLERFLDVTSQRHKLVTLNMANVDTPGYRTKDLNFRAELTRLISNGQENLAPITRPVPGLVERPDRNNVSLDRESILLAETQMQYGLGVQLLQHEFHNLLSAINEGGKG